MSFPITKEEAYHEIGHMMAFRLEKLRSDYIAIPKDPRKMNPAHHGSYEGASAVAICSAHLGGIAAQKLLLGNALPPSIVAAIDDLSLFDKSYRATFTNQDEQRVL